MNIHESIQSGIIESYVLGIATPEEIAEVEQMARQHPLVQQAIDDFSIMLEKQAMENAVVPPTEVKERVLAAIKAENKEATVTPIVPIKKNVIEESEAYPIKTIRVWQFVAAASIILLIGSAIVNAYLYDRYSTKEQQYQALLQESSSMQANNRIYQARLNELQSLANMMIDPAVAKVRLDDVSTTKEKMATVLWDTRTKDVYVIPNKLATPQAGKQYQLWAMVDGKPVDAGVIDPNCTDVCQMKNIPEAEAFAITLENAGGSPTPDLTQLMVLGKV